MRPVDADRLKEVFERNTGYDYHDLIDIAPTVERPHGKWKLRSPYEAWFEEYKCSNCNAYGLFNWNFCPNCGADMRKEGESN